MLILSVTSSGSDLFVSLLFSPSASVGPAVIGVVGVLCFGGVFEMNSCGSIFVEGLEERGPLKGNGPRSRMASCDTCLIGAFNASLVAGFIGCVIKW